MSITLAGAPENGDVVIFHTEDRPARTFEVLIKDIDRVAAAATMRQTPGAGNTSGAEASLALVPEEEQPNGFQYRIRALQRGRDPDTPGPDHQR